MIPIKIQCGCGQRYEFEVEPVGGQMPNPVACPACGADGTAAANTVIIQSAPPPPPAPAAAPRVRVAAPAQPEPTPSGRPSGRPGPGRLPGQLDPAQAEVEARAKISWGDSPETVIRFLMLQGFTRDSAAELVRGMFSERMAEIRGNGIKKIVTGSVLICVPIAFLLMCLHIGVLPLKLFAVTVMIGLYGAYMVLKGIFMVIAPKSEAGDVAEH